MPARHPVQALLTLTTCATSALWLAAGISPAFADSDDAELGEVTVTATRYAMPVASAPATVSVFTAARMEKQLVENIADLVRYEPGVSVRTAPARFTAAGSSTGRDGNSGFNIRGLEGNRVLIQVDGIRTPDAYSFGAQSVGRGDYVDLGLLKTAEILRGPSSALYGSDGVAGAVSFVTKDPADLLGNERDATARLHSSWAEVDDNLSHSLVGAGRIAGWEALIAYTRRDGEGSRTNGTNNSSNTDRTTRNPEDNNSNAALLKLVRELNDSNRLRLTWDHMDRRVDWNVLSAIAKPPLTSTSVLGLTAFDSMQRNRVTLDHFYEPDASWLKSLRTSVFHQDSTTRQFSAEDRNTAADRVRDATYDNRVRGAQIEAHSSINGSVVDQQFVFGGDFTITHQESLRDGVIPPAGETFPTRAFPVTDFTQAGLFVQDEIQWGSLSLFPALRWDYYKNNPKADALFVSGVPAEQSDSQVSPKLGAVLKLDENWGVFVNGAFGYKAPAANQINNGFSNPNSFYRTISNPDLKPETSRTLEAGVRHSSERWSANLTGYTGRYKDFIEQQLIGGTFTATDYGTYQYINLNSARIRGVEARSDLLLVPDLRWSVAAAYTRGHSEQGGVKTPLFTVDPLKIVSGLAWEPTDRPYGGEFIATHGARKAASRTGLTCTGGCYTPGSYVVYDAFGWWQLNDNATLRAGIFNVTDKKYAPWGDVRGISNTSTVKDAYSSPGRNLSASIVMQF
jgi:hemoglobin/transferrin/lactoferrin receptor protein